ncbi:hypothetical protein EDB19DRAFT_1909892 [Suillus lakei]|nr:hypothetical protein EDB19DRAFT_1909892 [Suillus lakei]
MSLNDTTSPAGYLDLLSQINPQSLTGFDPNIGSSQAQMFHLRDPMASSPLLFQDSLHSLLENDRLACKDSDTSLVAQLKRQLTESQHAVASLQADRLRLINENAGLNSTCQALQNVIVNIRGSASSVASTSSSLSTCDTSNIISDDQKPSTIRQFDRGQRRNGRHSIRKARPLNPIVLEAHLEDLGAWRKDEKGVPVSADRMKSIWNHMLSSFRQLRAQGLTPVSIGQASLQVLRWLIHTLCKEYIEFRLCADNWKAMKLMTENYSQWSTYHVKGKKTSKRVKAEPGEHDELEAEHTKKRARIDSDIISESVTEPSTSSTNEVIPDTLQHPSLNHEPTPPPSTDKGKGKEVPIVEVKNPLSNLLMKPWPRPVPPKLPPTSIDSSSSESNPAIVLPSDNITPVSLPNVPSSSNLTSLADLASLAVKMELVHANTIDSKADAIKKRQPSSKLMRVSPKITARNLCALEWQSNGHQKEPASVFATYWNRLPTADKELYKCKAVVQLASSAQAQTDDNHDQ